MDISCEQLLGAREEQQDYFATDELGEAHVIVLADGMGGETGGAVASETAAKAFLSTCRADSSRTRRERLATALNAANRALAEAITENLALDGMGTTLVGLWIEAPLVWWISVGDSPFFLLREGELRRLNANHSGAEPLLDSVSRGELSLDEARADPNFHALSSVVDGRKMELIDFCDEPLLLKSGDRLLVCSDGLETLPADVIRRLLLGAASAQDATQSLTLQIAEVADPQQDNCTLVTLFYDAQDRAVTPRATRAGSRRPIGGIALMLMIGLLAGGAGGWWIRGATDGSSPLVPASTTVPTPASATAAPPASTPSTGTAPDQTSDQPPDAPEAPPGDAASPPEHGPEPGNTVPDEDSS